MISKSLVRTVYQIGKQFSNFTERGGGMKMRKYQIAPADAILKSIKEKAGRSFVIIMSRQAGKDELSAWLKVFLLRVFSHLDVGIVEGNPTYKPQTINAIQRLESRFDANLLTRRRWRKRSDFIRRIGKAKVYFLSADKSANVVGATASLLLIINEAQDVDPAVFDKKFAPMGASTDSTRVYFGTVWTSRTLLARAMRECREEEKRDGFPRVFVYDADAVAKENPAYGRFVKKEVARLGRFHPFVKTQYYCEEIDAEATMFNAARRSLMIGDAPAHEVPQEGVAYAFLLDVAGQDEAIMEGGEEAPMSNPGRNATTLSIVSIDMSTIETLRFPTYRIVHRRSWVGVNHLNLFGQLKSVIEAWRPIHIVQDATGVGEGLWALLDRHFGEKVIPVKFSAKVKSDLGWQFLAAIETGRVRDCCPSEVVDRQYLACQSEILTGPAKLMRWGVPDGTRGEDGLFIFDDHVLADALVGQLDLLEWSLFAETSILETADVLKDMDYGF